MHETKIDNFILANNIDLEVVLEKSRGGVHYALMRIGLFGQRTYAVCILGDGYALETVGEIEEDALELFDLMMDGGVSPEHVFDVVSDFRREKEMEFS